MKIAILTQPLRTNYGGIMQAYALQKVLNDMGHEVTTINRQSDKRNIVVRALLRLKPIIYKLLDKNIYRRLTPKEQEYVFEGMISFLDKYINRSQPIDSNKKLINHFRKEAYDMVVVGSDQVWRPSYSANIYNYFLDFKTSVGSELKAISYAASFGVDKWEFNSLQTKKCRNLIDGFSGVSVRENDAINLCKENLGVKAEVVLDPTMLLDRTVYMELCGGSGSSGGKGVLTYILDQNASKSKLIKDISSNLSLPVFSCQPERSLSDGRGKTLSEYKYPSVEAWLKSFIDADYIITDSFHGCVFSLIFNKPFLAIANPQRGISRFTSLLNNLGLIDRLILLDDIDFKVKMSNKIDWNHVNNRLRDEKENSLNFLKNSFDIKC